MFNENLIYKLIQRAEDLNRQSNEIVLACILEFHIKTERNFWAKVIDGKQSGWADEIDGDLRPYKDTEIEEKRRLYGKYGDVFNQDTIGDVDERWK